MEQHGPVDKHDILERLASLEISSWSYLWEDRTVRHIGPMAQDFHTAFGVGASDRRIDMADGLGVVVAAIQALYERIHHQERALAELRERVMRLTNRAAGP
jgi:hypothetical protein